MSRFEDGRYARSHAEGFTVTYFRATGHVSWKANPIDPEDGSWLVRYFTCTHRHETLDQAKICAGRIETSHARSGKLPTYAKYD